MRPQPASLMHRISAWSVLLCALPLVAACLTAVQAQVVCAPDDGHCVLPGSVSFVSPPLLSSPLSTLAGNSGTFTAWVRLAAPAAGAASAAQTIASLGSAADAASSLASYLSLDWLPAGSDGLSPSQLRLRFGTETGSAPLVGPAAGSASSAVYSAVLTPSSTGSLSWIHAAFTFNAQGGRVILVNAMTIAQADVGYAFQPSANVASQQLILGARFTSADGQLAQFLSAGTALDEVHLYASALSTDEIVCVYLSNVVNAANGLVARFKFAEQVGNSTADSSGNGLVLSAQGGHNMGWQLSPASRPAFCNIGDSNSCTMDSSASAQFRLRIANVNQVAGGAAFAPAHAPLMSPASNNPTAPGVVSLSGSEYLDLLDPFDTANDNSATGSAAFAPGWTLGGAGDSGLSIVSWMRLDDLSTNYPLFLFSAGSTAVPTNCSFHRVSLQATWSTSSYLLRFTIAGPTGAVLCSWDSSALRVAQSLWTQVGVMWSPAGGAKFILDGRMEVGAASGGCSLSSIPAVARRSVLINRHCGGAFATARIAGFALYNRTLTTNEVQGLALTPPSSVVPLPIFVNSVPAVWSITQQQLSPASASISVPMCPLVGISASLTCASPSFVTSPLALVWLAKNAAACVRTASMQLLFPPLQSQQSAWVLTFVLTATAPNTAVASLLFAVYPAAPLTWTVQGQTANLTESSASFRLRHFSSPSANAGWTAAPVAASGGWATFDGSTQFLDLNLPADTLTDTDQLSLVMPPFGNIDDTPAGMTIAMWLQFGFGRATTISQSLFDCGAGPDSVMDRVILSVDSQLWLSVYRGLQSMLSCSTSLSLGTMAGVWVNVAVTLSPAGICTFFINGVPQPLSAPNLYGCTASMQAIGGCNPRMVPRLSCQIGYTNGVTRFLGALAEFAFYPRALLPLEIQPFAANPPLALRVGVATVILSTPSFVADSPSTMSVSVTPTLCTSASLTVQPWLTDGGAVPLLAWGGSLACGARSVSLILYDIRNVSTMWILNATVSGDAAAMYNLPLPSVSLFPSSPEYTLSSAAFTLNLQSPPSSDHYSWAPSSNGLGGIASLTSPQFLDLTTSADTGGPPMPQWGFQPWLPQLAARGGLSFAMWVSVNTGGLRLQCFRTAGTVDGFLYSISTISSFTVYNPAGGPSISFYSGSSPALQWTHLALTMDSSSLRIYINGNLVVSQSPSPFPTLVDRPNCQFLSLSSLASSIAGLQMWTRALLPSEVEQLASSPPPSLLSQQLTITGVPKVAAPGFVPAAFSVHAPLVPNMLVVGISVQGNLGYAVPSSLTFAQGIAALQAVQLVFTTSGGTPTGMDWVVVFTLSGVGAASYVVPPPITIRIASRNTLDLSLGFSLYTAAPSLHAGFLAGVATFNLPGAVSNQYLDLQNFFDSPNPAGTSASPAPQSLMPTVWPPAPNVFGVTFQMWARLDGASDRVRFLECGAAPGSSTDLFSWGLSPAGFPLLSYWNLNTRVFSSPLANVTMPQGMFVHWAMTIGPDGKIASFLNGIRLAPLAASATAPPRAIARTACFAVQPVDLSPTGRFIGRIAQILYSERVLLDAELSIAASNPPAALLPAAISVVGMPVGVVSAQGMPLSLNFTTELCVSSLLSLQVCVKSVSVLPSATDPPLPLCYNPVALLLWLAGECASFGNTKTVQLQLAPLEPLQTAWIISFFLGGPAAAIFAPIAPRVVSTNIVLCPPGQYCPSSSIAPINCPSGTYGSDAGLTTALCSGLCPAGFLCAEGTISYAGSACPAGHYCAHAGTLVAQPCAPGYWCPPASTSATQISCGSRSVFCPAGSATPTRVQVGFFTIGANQTANAASSLLLAAVAAVDEAHQVAQLPCLIGHACDGSGVMRACPPGFFQSLSHQSVCTPCSTGSVSEAFNSSACHPCSGGTYAATASSCVDCGPGRFSEEGAALCTDCAVGTASDAPALSASACPACPNSTYSSAIGSTRCLDCLPPNYSPSPALCVECATAVSEDGRSCLPTGCPANYEATATRSCAPCPLSTGSAAGARCVTCPATFFTPSAGSGCVSCQQAEMEGLLCENGLANVQPGHWAFISGEQASSTDQSVMYPRLRTARCPTGFCAGGPLQVRSDPAQSAANSSDVYFTAAAQCQYPRDTSAGNLLCGSCQPGFVLWDRECVECSSPNRGLQFLGVVLAFALVWLLLHNVFSISGRTPHSASSTSGLLSVLLYFIQIGVLEVGPLSQALLWLQAVNLNMSSLGGKGGCIAPISPEDQLLLSMLMPVLLTVVLLVLMALHFFAFYFRLFDGMRIQDATAEDGAALPRRWGARLARHCARFRTAEYIGGFISILLFCFTGSAQSCFTLLSCSSVGDNSVVFDAPSIHCSAGSFRGYHAYAIVVLLLLVIALPIAAFVLVAYHMKQQRDRDDNNKQAAAAGKKHKIEPQVEGSAEDPRPPASPSNRDSTDEWVSNPAAKVDLASADSSAASTAPLPRASSDRVADSLFLARFGVLYAIFRRRAWYWTSFVLIRRTCFVAVNTLLIQDPEYRIMAFLLLHGASLLIHMQVRAFPGRFINDTDTALHVCLLVISILLTRQPPLPAAIPALIAAILITPPLLLALWWMRREVASSRSGGSSAHATHARPEEDPADSAAVELTAVSWSLQSQRGRGSLGVPPPRAGYTALRVPLDSGSSSSSSSSAAASSSPALASGRFVDLWICAQQPRDAAAEEKEQRNLIASAPEDNDDDQREAAQQQAL